MSPLPPAETIALFAAFTAVLMVGSAHLRVNLWFLSVQTTLLSVVTSLFAIQRSEPHLWIVCILFFVLKAVFVPQFLSYIVKIVKVQRDAGIVVPTPIAMHLSIGFMIVSYILARQLPHTGWPMSTAAVSLVCTGLVLMLTRRVALSQIVGFLVMENGIYLFGLSQMHGMPLFIEMGIMLDLMAGVMITGLVIFRIKKNFEHIDVTLLSELKE
ncbi:MAG TPA: hypothetical protein V6C97_23730 [Oculatellaceae cyanobacterium]